MFVGVARSIKSDGFIVKEKTVKTELAKEAKFTKDGQTIKSGPKKGKKHRKHHIENEDTEFLEGVPYSLNKKNRWLFASEIKSDNSHNVNQQVTLFTENRGLFGRQRARRRQTWYIPNRFCDYFCLLEI